LREAQIARGAQGIEAKIPQTRRRRGEELQRKARFFCGSPAKKCAKPINMTQKK
jgi:hypothetical protein